jgi:hypothetical protein
MNTSWKRRFLILASGTLGLILLGTNPGAWPQAPGPADERERGEGEPLTRNSVQERLLQVTAFAVDVKPAPGTHGEARKDDDRDHHENFAKCAKACADCQQQCDACFHHCAKLLADGMKEHAKSMRLCLDCAELCAAASRLVARHSPLSAAACEACAKGCDLCAASCEHLGADMHMVACAKECRACAKECRAMMKYLHR